MNDTERIATKEPAKGYWVIGSASKKDQMWLADTTARCGGPFGLIVDESQFGGKVEWVSLDARYPSIDFADHPWHWGFWFSVMVFIGRFCTKKYLTKKVDRNYRARAKHIFPDTWYWADAALAVRGYYFDNLEETVKKL